MKGGPGYDALHKAKISAYHLLLGYANDFPPANDRPLKSYVNTMKMCAVEMRGGATRDDGTTLIAAAAISSNSGGASTEVAFIASKT